MADLNPLIQHIFETKAEEDAKVLFQQLAKVVKAKQDLEIKRMIFTKQKKDAHDREKRRCFITAFQTIGIAIAAFILLHATAYFPRPVA